MGLQVERTFAQGRYPSKIKAEMRTREGIESVLVSWRPPPCSELLELLVCSGENEQGWAG